MDRETLVRRNRQMSEAFHQQPLRHQVRRWMIQSVARFPFAPLNRGWNRILFIKPDHLGDMLLATPAMKALKAARPYTEIHVLANPISAQLLANYPEIDVVLTIDFPGFDRHNDKPTIYSPYTHLVKISRQLRHIGYGSAIIMRPDHWWGAMLAHVAGIRERIGYDLADVKPFLTTPIPYRHEHVVRQNLRLIEDWTGVIDDQDVDYDFRVFEDDREHVNTYLKTFGIAPDERVICIHPGAGSWVKLWQDEKWAKVADTLVDQLDTRIIFTGTDSERAMINRIQNRMQHHSCTTAGDLNFNQLGALYARAGVVLGPDSGPLHLAAAVDCPTVTLFGPADPVEFGPWGDHRRHMILTSPIGCRPCRVLDWGDDAASNHPCMQDISIGQVLEAARLVADFKRQVD